jgi:hypothetical protein
VVCPYLSTLRRIFSSAPDLVQKRILPCFLPSFLLLLPTDYFAAAASSSDRSRILSFIASTPPPHPFRPHTEQGRGVGQREGYAKLVWVVNGSGRQSEVVVVAMRLLARVVRDVICITSLLFFLPLT